MIKNGHETYFKIIKSLHEPKTRKQLEQEVGLEERELREYLNTDHFEFCGVEFPINIRINKASNKAKRDRRGRQPDIIVSDSDSSEDLIDNDPYHRSTVNPIVLPLNMTEAYALTNLLVDLTRHTDYGEIYENIANKIYPQLTDYAKSRIGKNIYGLQENGLVQFTSEEGLFKKTMPKAIMYALKSGREVIISRKKGNTIVGKVEYIEGRLGIRSDRKDYFYDEIKGDILKVEEK